MEKSKKPLKSVQFRFRPSGIWYSSPPFEPMSDECGRSEPIESWWRGNRGLFDSTLPIKREWSGIESSQSLETHFHACGSAQDSRKKSWLESFSSFDRTIKTLFYSHHTFSRQRKKKEATIINERKNKQTNHQILLGINTQIYPKCLIRLQRLNLTSCCRLLPWMLLSW